MSAVKAGANMLAVENAVRIAGMNALTIRPVLNVRERPERSLSITSCQPF
jgi:hypothetical protein